MAGLFDLPTETKTKASTHRELWEKLRKAAGYDYLRDEQGQVLQPLENAMQGGAKDILVTMPTGTGKTALGLLVGRLRQLNQGSRVLYLTPTNQLARQVVREAKTKLGIPAVDLTGPYADVDAAAKAQYRDGQAIGVASYPTLFNPTPAVPEPEVVISDDVHAAGDYIKRPWCLEVEGTLFVQAKEVISNVSPDLKWPDGKGRQDHATLLPHRDWLLAVEQLAALFDATKDDKFQWYWKNRVRGNLHKSFCFLDDDRITIQPWVAPTQHFSHFEQASLRLYLSATIDQVGHVERIIGKPTVVRIQPEAPPVPGKRLILNTNAIFNDEGVTDEDRVIEMVKRFPKSLILTRTLTEASDLRSKLEKEIDGLPVLGEDPDEDVEKFHPMPRGALVLANRYDGIDLGGNKVQHLVIYGAPNAIGVQERFTTKSWHTDRVSWSRGRQRIVQGLGRCTRGKADKCVVSLVGEDVSNLLFNPTVFRALPRRIRGELNAARKFTKTGMLNELLDAFSKDSEAWQRYYDNFDTEAQGFALEQQEDEAIRRLNTSEVDYARRIYEGAFEKAVEVAVKAAGACTEEDMAKHAADWHYLASVAADLAEHRSSASPYSGVGSEELQRAVEGASGRPWLGDLERVLKMREVPADDKAQVERIMTYCASAGIKDKTKQITSGLKKPKTKSETDVYEAALSELGRSMGYEAFKPNRDGAPDSIWYVGPQAHLILESKAEKEEGASLSIKEIRQMQAQPSEVQTNEKIHPPADKRVFCIADCETYDEVKQGDLDAFVVASTKTVKSFAGRWCFALSGLAHLGKMPAPVRAWATYTTLRRFVPAKGTLSTALGAVDPKDAMKPA